MGLGENKNAYYLKWALGAEAGSRKGISLWSWEPKLGAETPARAISELQVTPLKNPLGPQLRVLAVWGILLFIYFLK